ncbi:MAG TPA: FixH family protein [Alphaproteobacteria bacterium]|nr:FixH family protein [Alphaproteobacteria bacterium]
MSAIGATQKEKPATGPRPSDKWIPWYIVLFFVGITCVLGTFTWIALSTHTGTVTDDAYKKGLAYNETIHQADAQKAWGYAPSLARAGNDVVFTLKDAAGLPVQVTAAAIWFFRPADARGDVRGDMTADAAGALRYDAKALARGLWEVRVLATTPKGAYQYSKRMVFE